MGMTNVNLVTGAGGFIGGHLVKRLLAEGRPVRAVDIKHTSEWHQRFEPAENVTADLSDRATCREVTEEVDEIYHLAADMGGWDYIDSHKVECSLNVLLDTHMLLAARAAGVRRFFYASSACVYNESLQTDPLHAGLKESDAYPANPSEGYGWEKLFAERMCRYFAEGSGLITRVARFHNIYGPYGDWIGGREKAPAAFCRRIIEAHFADRREIEIDSNGEQSRSFTYVDDCVEGILRIMRSDIDEPINLGSSELVTINRLVELIEEIADFTVGRVYRTDKSGGVRGRNSDNALIKQRLQGWEPSTPLRVGLRNTYEWIRGEIVERQRSY
jgi:nucleoside-diphosphate-sugar epimerase